MTGPIVNWRNAQLPPKTAVFAIGDIHAYHDLLRPMLEEIETKIAALPVDVQAHVIFIGDYIDRGPNGSKTIDMLLSFEKRMKAHSNAHITFLCGNHEEYFIRLLRATRITDNIIGDPKNLGDHNHCLTDVDGSMSIAGLKAWLFRGGGVTTVKNYLPNMDADLLSGEKPLEVEAATILTQQLRESVPKAHKDFLERIYANSHTLIGDYLFTHAGVDPEKTLAEQGIGEGAVPLKGKGYFDFLMLRNPFLWRNEDTLPHCPYVVVHGHTPSEIPSDIQGLYTGMPTANGSIIADGQKNYRLCLDTNVYKPEGALTCFIRYEDQAGFMAVNRSDPDKIIEYSIPEVGQHVAARFHQQKYPEYHRDIG